MIRSNTKRFLNALLNELTNWICKTRYQSARLLKMIVVLCEESLTIESYLILPALIKAIDFAKSDKEQMLLKELLEVCDLLGRYLSPDTYIRYILPRLSGDPSVVQFATDASSRCTVLEVLGSLLAGSRQSLVADRFIEIAEALSDPFIIPCESVSLRGSALYVWETLLDAQMAQDKYLKESHYALKGRTKSIKDAFKSLLVDTNASETKVRASLCLKNLSIVCSVGGEGGIVSLFSYIGCEVMSDVMLNYEMEGDWSPSSPQHIIFETLVRCPCTLRSPKFDLCSVFDFLCNIISADNLKVLSGESCGACLLTFASILCHLFKFYLRGDQRMPITLSEFEMENDSIPEPVKYELQSKLSSALSNKFDSICNAFVFDMRWNSNDSLVVVRFNAIDELLMSSTILALDVPRDTFALNLMETVIPFNLKPERAGALRIHSSRLALHMAEEMFDKLQLRSIYSSDKLTSDQWTTIRSLAYRFKMNNFIRVLVGMLFDCEDEIIEIALQALALILHFASVETNDEPPLLRCILDASFQLPLSLSSRDNLRCMNLLDFLLRSAAALNLSVFEDALHTFESHLGQASNGYELMEFSSGLRDHIGVLQMLHSE